MTLGDGWWHFYFQGCSLGSSESVALADPPGGPSANAYKAPTNYHCRMELLNGTTPVYDTGWVSDEDPVEIAERKTAEHRFHPPLDIVDGAARIVDPIKDGLTGEGIPIIPVEQVVDGIMDLFGEESGGHCHFVQHGMETQEFNFRRVPGPRPVAEAS